MTNVGAKRLFSKRAPCVSPAYTAFVVKMIINVLNTFDKVNVNEYTMREYSDLALHSSIQYLGKETASSLFSLVVSTGQNIVKQDRC